MMTERERGIPASNSILLLPIIGIGVGIGFLILGSKHLCLPALVLMTESRTPVSGLTFSFCQSLLRLPHLVLMIEGGTPVSGFNLLPLPWITSLLGAQVRRDLGNCR